MDFLLKDISDETINQLRVRAAKNNQSIENEIAAIIWDKLGGSERPNPIKIELIYADRSR